MKPPPPFLSVLLHNDLASFDPATGKHVVGLMGLCAGFEDGKWRANQLAEYLVDVFLPEFALRHSELEPDAVTRHTMIRLVKSAARAVYTTKKFEKRGEFGELLLHAILAKELETMPAVSKIYYKSAPNDVVKGFDAVHVREAAGGGLELWLGEAKFYGNPLSGMRDAIKSLRRLSDTDFLRDEFAVVVRMIDSAWPHADALKQLLDKNTSLDQIFEAVSIPVLLTYDSKVLAAHTRHTPAYEAAVVQEWMKHHQYFATKPLPKNVRIHLILMPLNDKKRLIAQLDRELRRWH